MKKIMIAVDDSLHSKNAVTLRCAHFGLGKKYELCSFSRTTDAFPVPRG